MNRKGYYVMLTALLILLMSMGGVTAQEPGTEKEEQGNLPPPATVSSKIHFQGVLKESGSPVTGSRNMIFRLFSNSACTNQVGGDIVKNGVSVTDGLFAVALEVTHSNFNGQERWIEPEVGGAKIGCHEILPVPYALSLRPGAQVVGDQTGSNAIYASNTATTGASYGIRGDSASTIGQGVSGYASAGSGTTYGVYGWASSADGYGVYGLHDAGSGTNPGVYGETDSTSGYAAGVTGRVDPTNPGSYSAGVRGINDGTGGLGIGVYGSQAGGGWGVYGTAVSGRGVYGYASATTGTNYGVYGFTDSPVGIGVAGFQPGYSTSDSESLFWKPGGLFGGSNGVIGISKLTNGIGAGGWSKHATGPNYGVYGQTESTAGIGMYGLANATTGTTYGVYGETNSTGGSGVYGLHTADSGTNPGVYGETDSTSSYAAGVTGRVDPTNPGSYSAGVRGINDGTGGNGIGVWGSQDGSGWGVYGTAVSGRGMYGYASASSGGRIGVRGDVNGSGYGLYTSDNLYVAGSCTGCTIVFISTNTSQQTLQVGDAVAVSGVGSVLKGHSVPVLEVRRAMASDVSVLGVVHSRGEFYAANGDQSEDDDSVQPVEGNVAPGDYLFVVTSGLAQVRVAPTLTALTPGQRLTIGAIAGRAALAGADAEPDTVFARVMEAQADENGLVWAMIGGR